MVTTLKELATLALPTTPLVSEGSFGTVRLGSYASTMTLYEDRDENSREPVVFIEWDFPDLETTECIGLELEGGHVVGYDGVHSFPRPAKPWLISLGYTVADDVI